MDATQALIPESAALRDITDFIDGRRRAPGGGTYRDIWDPSRGRVQARVRLGTAEDVAPVCVFLASDAARYVTGQVIGVDGGMIV